MRVAVIALLAAVARFRALVIRYSELEPRREVEMAIKIGTGPDSWGVWFPDDPKDVPWQRYLDEVAEAGYEWTEAGPHGYLPIDVNIVTGELKRRGLKMIASAVMNGHLDDPDDWPKIESTVLGAGEFGASLGAKYLFLIDDTYLDLFSGQQVADTHLDDDGWKRLIDSTHKVAEMARDRFGLTLTFHPHAETHVQTEEEVEKLLEDTDAGLVSLLLDTGHHAYAGGDPVGFLRKHHRRISYLHLKNVDGAKLQRVREEKMPMVEATKMGVFCEPQDGLVDFESLSAVLREVGYDGWATVEQDMFQPPLDVPLPVAKRTRQYLKDIGIG